MLSFTDGIIPARFLLMCAYTVIIIVAIYSREANVIACLPNDYTKEDYNRKDLSLKTGYIAALGLLIFELIGFISGTSTFMPFTTLASIAAHGLASILMSCYLMYEWDCGFYWWIFGLGSILPAFMEVFSFVSILFLWSAWGIARLRQSIG